MRHWNPPGHPTAVSPTGLYWHPPVLLLAHSAMVQRTVLTEAHRLESLTPGRRLYGRGRPEAGHSDSMRMHSCMEPSRECLCRGVR